MKRFLTLLSVIAMVMTAMAQSSGIVLSYNKGQELKFYGAYQLDKAIEDAEVNDTIYFGPGEYDLSVLPEKDSDSKKLIKPLTFIGSGAHSEGTSFTGVMDLYLDVDPSLDHSKKVFSFEGLRLDVFRIRPYSDLKELKLVNFRCNYYSEIEEKDKGGIVDNLIIDRCSLSVLALDSYSTKHVTVNNTKIYQEFTGRSDSSYGIASFDHCLIEFSCGTGIIRNSIIQEIQSGSATSYEHCVYNTDCYGKSSLKECISRPKYWASDLDKDPSSLGICEDGTVYGTLGGETPFTLFPQFPTADASESYLDYDALNKKLTINVKLLGD
ncbi:MAG: hypothetical protein K2L45_07280 [Muribaculaceae bacterium]|nr:hypothetical protein [Muribaculaceae bacterium]